MGWNRQLPLQRSYNIKPGQLCGNVKINLDYRFILKQDALLIEADQDIRIGFKRLKKNDGVKAYSCCLALSDGDIKHAPCIPLDGTIYYRNFFPL